MKRRHALALLAIFLVLIAQIATIATGSRTRFFILPFALYLLIVRITSKSPAAQHVLGTLRRGYTPRRTDAGKWVEAPVAELDKSTVGKLLASRLRREPGLHVVVRTEPPKVCTDALYDPELDG